MTPVTTTTYNVYTDNAIFQQPHPTTLRHTTLNLAWQCTYPHSCSRITNEQVCTGKFNGRVANTHDPIVTRVSSECTISITIIKLPVVWNN